MKTKTMKNKDLDEPLCFREEDGEQISIQEYDAEHEYNCDVMLTEDGYLYLMDGDIPADTPELMDQKWEDYEDVPGEIDLGE